ncbi:hypothetical protein AB1Y20_005900 [Prymnesium parvum]|uniref:Staphylococcus aureus surface protein A n=1 Tax=Prymnesium parvum TaxID=97485 RepID=A0AB34J122_PRYPA
MAVAASRPFHGYALRFPSPGAMGGIRNIMLNSSDPQIAPLALGFTFSVWLRFDDITPSRYQYPLAFVSSQDDFMHLPFGGPLGGTTFGRNWDLGTSPVSNLSTRAFQWHSYIETWEPSAGAVRTYIDGVLYASRVGIGIGRNPLQASASLFLGSRCSMSVSSFFTASAVPECYATTYGFIGEMDDLAIYVGALSTAQVATIWNAPVASAGSSPTPVFAYNFDEVLGGDAPYVRNIGSTGAQYDLLLGRISRGAGADSSQSFCGATNEDLFTDERVTIPFLAPIQVPRSSDGAARLSGGPLVLLAPIGAAAVTFPTSSGAEVTVRLLTANSDPPNATYYWVAATATVNEHTVFQLDSTHAVHLVRIRRPSMPTAQLLAGLSDTSMREDASADIQLWGINHLGSALPALPYIVRPPAKGQLWLRGRVGDPAALLDTAGQLAVDPRALGGNTHVTYVPQPDGSGEAYDSFTFRLQLDGSAAPLLTADVANISSDAAHFTMAVIRVNDLPRGRSYQYQLVEDAPPLLVNLSATDAEVGEPLDIFISSLPKLGGLYHVDDVAVDPITGRARVKEGAQRIAEPFNSFGISGTALEQYASRVISVSTFWGAAPSIDCHPLSALGPPDCQSWGECVDETPWTKDASVYPPVGQRVQVGQHSLLAYVRHVNASAGLLAVDLAPMYKKVNGSLTQCAIPLDAPDEAVYPTWCSTTDLRTRYIVSRNEISPAPGKWCVPSKGYSDVTYQGTGSFAFGAEYEFSDWSHREVYESQGYTEYIELGIKTPVYPLAILIGQPRGMGAIVRIQVRASSGRWTNWTTVYDAPAQRSQGDFYLRSGQYWTWQPAPFCRPHHRISEVRLELDTSSQTGIADWNYIDYVLVIGTESLQPAAMESALPAYVYYVPDNDAHGIDKFEYRVTDCSGERIRTSEPNVLDFTITAVNDAPQALVQSFSQIVKLADPGDEAAAVLVDLPCSDVDDSLDTLSMEITELPTCGAVYTVVSGSANGVRDGSNAIARTLGERISSVPSAIPLIPQASAFRVWFQIGSLDGCLSSQMSAINQTLFGALSPEHAEWFLAELFDLQSKGQLVGAALIRYRVTDPWGEVATAYQGVLAYSSEVIEKTEMWPLVLIGIGATLGFLLIVLLAERGYARYKRHLDALKERARARHRDSKRLQTAVQATQKLSFPFVLMPLKNFQSIGKLITHEEARDAGHLKFVDTSSAVTDFVAHGRVIFISHQWLGSHAPDPGNIHYPSILKGVDRLLEMKNIDASRAYIWCDYFSIPQVNKACQMGAISSIPQYAFNSAYFLVCAPPAIHSDTGLRVDVTTYLKRGWCRLECWAYLALNNAVRMYALTNDEEGLKCFAQNPDWFHCVLDVISGEFTVESDRMLLVDTILGLHALGRLFRNVLAQSAVCELSEVTSASQISDHAGTAEKLRPSEHLARLDEFILEQSSKIFPKQYFGDLVETLESELSAHRRHEELRTRAWKDHPDSLSGTLDDTLQWLTAKMLMQQANLSRVSSTTSSRSRRSSRDKFFSGRLALTKASSIGAGFASGRLSPKKESRSATQPRFVLETTPSSPNLARVEMTVNARSVQ